MMKAAADHSAQPRPGGVQRRVGVRGQRAPLTLLALIAAHNRPFVKQRGLPGQIVETPFVFSAVDLLQQQTGTLGLRASMSISVVQNSYHPLRFTLPKPATQLLSC